MIKLIASDIDGTLVVEGTNHINPEIFEVIMKLKEKGIHFAAASGRQAASIEHLFEPIRDKIFYLAENGAYIGCYGRVLFSNSIESSVIKKLIEYGRQVPNCDVMLSTPSMIYTDSNNQEFLHWMEHGYHMKVQKVEDLLLVREDIIKISLNTTSQIEEVFHACKSAYGDLLKVTISGDSWIDCTALGVNKATAIQVLQESLEITEEETMVFGDQLNDIEMMKQGHYSFAVANARQEVREAARFIAESNVNDGVLKILKTLL